MVAWENEIEGYTYYIKLEKKLSDNTVEAYLRDLRQMAAYMESEFSISDPEQVREQHVESFLAYLYDKGVEKTTQARVLSGIKSFFTYLLINDRIDSLPTEFIDTPKIGRKLPDVLSAAEVDAMLDGIDLSLPFGHRNRAIMEMLYGCGLRVTELVTLRIGDLFFEEATSVSSARATSSAWCRSATRRSGSLRSIWSSDQRCASIRVMPRRCS